ncbi:MAG TPA: hypothetical protein VFW11_01540 [Cyclobacteriaceae bacterium]|nr:hypothetical protein [Cyclobacteriaceae bacterium]
MKYILISILLLTCTNTYSQEKPSGFDAEKWQPPYTLVAPGNWSIERFPIPIEFAPSIHYRGVEDLRFAPGWADAKSDEYWTYAFLWFLEGKQTFEGQILEQHLKAYYSGLVGRNIEPRKISEEKLIPVNSRVTKTHSSAGDQETYTGTVSMLDYMEQKPIVLNCVIHVKSCPEKDNTFVFIEISPQPTSHAIWQSLNQIWTGFDCNSD